MLKYLPLILFLLCSGNLYANCNSGAQESFESYFDKQATVQTSNMFFDCIEGLYQKQKKEVSGFLVGAGKVVEATKKELKKLAPDSFFECLYFALCPAAYLINEKFEEEEELQKLFSYFTEFFNDAEYRNKTISNLKENISKMKAELGDVGDSLIAIPGNLSIILEAGKNSLVNIDISEVLKSLCILAAEYGLSLVIGLITGAVAISVVRGMKNAKKLKSISKKLENVSNFLQKKYSKKYGAIIKCSI